ncbi:MAG: glycosyltransferase family 4 protein [Pseudomonadota bacterium]
MAARIAEQMDVPYLLSIQGNTDLKILRMRPDLRSVFRRTWHGAAHVFPFAPWAGNAVSALLGKRSRPVTYLPCPGQSDRIYTPRITAPVVRTAFNLHDWKNKNVSALIKAIAIAAQDVPDIKLEVIGGGDADAFARLSALAERVAPRRVRFLGTVPNEHVQALLNASACFALPSHRESYGLVFAEALLSGAPCLIPKDRAIDGYFDDGSVLKTCLPRDVASIANGLVEILQNQRAFKERLEKLQRSGGLDHLRRNGIAQMYTSSLSGIEAKEAVKSEIWDVKASSRKGTLLPV